MIELTQAQEQIINVIDNLKAYYDRRGLKQYGDNWLNQKAEMKIKRNLNPEMK
jgi:hypothetical protein